MNPLRFEGFSAGLFQFLSGLGENNSKDWFDQHRGDYEMQVLGTMKAYVSELGPIMRMLNEDFEIEPRVGRTISRINNDIRFHKDRPPYRTTMYTSFPRKGEKWNTGALLYTGVSSRGLTIGFYPGGYRKLLIGPVQENIRKESRLFQRYLDERQIPQSYWELAGGDGNKITKWPLPKTSRRWINLENFIVGEYFPASDRRLGRRSFLDRAQGIVLDLYPLWLFATSSNLRRDLDLYYENAELLARPLTRAAG